MRTIISTLSLCILLLCSCQSKEGKASLIISFDRASFLAAKNSLATKSSPQLPDTEDFILTVTNSNGQKIYNGRFGDSPEELIVAAGNYTISAVSSIFEEPCYEKAVWGDSQVVVVKQGSKASVVLHCKQTNSGLRLKIEDSFKRLFPDGPLYLQSSSGKLIYEYDETRTAFFHPGSVKVSVWNGNAEEELFVRNLSEQQILTMRISASSASTSSGISIEIDSTRNYLSDRFTYGKEGGMEPEDAYSVIEAKNYIGRKDVWVHGYIVGSIASSSNFEYSYPFSKNSNILLGLRSGTTESDYCLSVELKSTAIREALNLVDNPSIRGRQVRLKGEIVSAYYGITGMKNVSEYQFF